jgi:hypothetical protein
MAERVGFERSLKQNLGPQAAGCNATLADRETHEIQNVPEKSGGLNRSMQHHLIEMISFRGGVDETRKTVWALRELAPTRCPHVRRESRSAGLAS